MTVPKPKMVKMRLTLAEPPQKFVTALQLRRVNGRDVVVRLARTPKGKG